MRAATFFQDLVERLRPFPWLALAGLSLALFAQFLLEPVARVIPAIVFYMAACGFIMWSILRGEWKLAPPPQEAVDLQGRRPRLPPLFLSLPLLAGAFYLFGVDRFTVLNLVLWLSGTGLLVASLWMPQQRSSIVRRVDWEWIALLVTVLALAAFFRFYRIAEVPAEPFSDHAEKLLDVYDISQGKTSIFFERNTGREAIQMYWTLLVKAVFGTGFSFISLKIGTTLLGLFILPFIYLLGREFGGPLVGFFALFLFGIAYWPNVISRIGLRFPLYPLFAAPTLLFLIRGLRSGSRNDFILCGLFLGLGLHGYSPFRIMPLLVIAAFGLFLLHTRSKETRIQALWGFVIVAVVSFVIFLPLLRFWLAHPDVFGFRALSRLGLGSREIAGEVWFVFLSNLLRGLLMFNWDDGDIWVNSIPHRPALDVVTGALFAIGILLLIARYLRERDWRDLFLLVSIPLLLMPSILSLAFPKENPALNRASGAAVAAILVSARALEGFIAGFGAEKKRAFIAHGIVAVLLSASAWQNYDLVFRKFDASFRLAVWNSSEMADVIHDRADIDTAWIVPYPQWVDTRLPAILLGSVDRDLALWPDDFSATRELPGPKLFLFKPEDFETENALKQLYPGGTLSRYTSVNIGKDFMIFFVEE
jgi:hypothetical protein